MSWIKIIYCRYHTKSVKKQCMAEQLFVNIFSTIKARDTIQTVLESA